MLLPQPSLLICLLVQHVLLSLVAPEQAPCGGEPLCHDLCSEVECVQGMLLLVPLASTLPPIVPCLTLAPRLSPYPLGDELAAPLHRATWNTGLYQRLCIISISTLMSSCSLSSSLSPRPNFRLIHSLHLPLSPPCHCSSILTHLF